MNIYNLNRVNSFKACETKPSTELSWRLKVFGADHMKPCVRQCGKVETNSNDGKTSNQTQNIMAKTGQPQTEKSPH